MIRTFLTLFVSVLLAAAASPAVYAQEEAPAAEQDPLLEAQENAIEKTHDLLADLVEPLSEEEQAHFFMAYNNYNLIGTTRVVRGDVKAAIEQCGVHNGEMKEALDTRFKAWDAQITPVLDEAQGHLDNMVIAQNYAKKADIDAVFKSIDETRERTDARFDKVPVTTPEACEYLLGKMDETQESLLSLLRSTLVSYPQSLPEDAAPASDDSKSPEEL